MLRIYYGPKGAGKSKRIISECNDHVQRAHGTIVYIDDDKSRSSEVLHRVRFIDSSDYDVKNDQFLLGFISGIVAQDHDLEAIYLDGFDSMVSTPLNELKPFIEILEKIIQDNNIDFYLSINSETLPEYLQPCGVELK